MKLIKKYFLLFSPAPFIINFVIFVVMLMGVAIWGLITSPNGYDATPMVQKVSFLLPILIVGNIILCYIIRSKYITFDDDERDKHRLVLVTEEERTIVKKPLWKKGEEYFLINPYKYYGWDNSEVCVATNIKGAYKNTTMIMPVTLTLKLDKPFDELELFNLLHDKFPQEKKLEIGAYVQDVFHKFNVNNQDKINDIMGCYAQKLISEPELLNQIVENIFFPEKLFDNVIDTTICVKEVTFSSCKGMTCETAIHNN